MGAQSLCTVPSHVIFHFNQCSQVSWYACDAAAWTALLVSHQLVHSRTFSQRGVCWCIDADAGYVMRMVFHLCLFSISSHDTQQLNLFGPMTRLACMRPCIVCKHCMQYLVNYTACYHISPDGCPSNV